MIISMAINFCYAFQLRIELIKPFDEVGEGERDSIY